MRNVAYIGVSQSQALTHACLLYNRDIREVVPQVRARFPSAPLFAIGWSLGANILVNYLGEEGAAGRPAPLDAAASMCNPFDLVACDRALETGMVRRPDVPMPPARALL